MRLKIKNPKTLKRLTWLAHKLIYYWLRTLRVEIRALQNDYHPEAPYMQGGKRVIYCVWHEYMVLPSIRFGPRNMTVLASEHGDGEIITQLIERFGITVVRGSTSRKAVSALMGMLRAGTMKHLGLTPDGPRGPRRVAQAGAVYLAWKTQLELVPVGVSFAKTWRLKSWDRFALPKPLSRARIVQGIGIKIPTETTVEQLPDYLHRFQQEMDRATRVADHWVQTGVYDPKV